jgi:hypothetical protein
MLPSIGRRVCPSQNQTSPLTRFLLVILMIVKEASYLSLERRRLLQVTDGAGAVEELPLELRGGRSSTWPVAMSITSLAAWLKSRGRLRRLVIPISQFFKPSPGAIGDPVLRIGLGREVRDFYFWPIGKRDDDQPSRSHLYGAWFKPNFGDRFGHTGTMARIP